MVTGAIQRFTVLMWCFLAQMPGMRLKHLEMAVTGKYVPLKRRSPLGPPGNNQNDDRLMAQFVRGLQRAQQIWTVGLPCP